MASALVGAVLLLAFFGFPESAYIRQQPDSDRQETSTTSASEKGEAASAAEPVVEGRPPGKTPSYLASLKILHRSLTTESLPKLILRPLGLICLPPVLWSALVEAATIGFLIAATSNVSVAFNRTYGFETWQVGLCFTASIIGSLVGIPAGGQMGDAVADWLTRRNGGIREPEMRLPAMMPCLIGTPLGLILYGVGIQYRLHWMCPTMGLAICKPLFFCFVLFPTEILPSPTSCLC